MRIGVEGRVSSRGFAKLVAGVLVGLVAFQAVKGALPQEPSNVKWLSTYSAGREISAKQRLPLILLFSAKWCDSCQALKRETLRDPSVEALLELGVAVEINVDDPANRRLVDEFQVSAIPAVHVVSGDGNRIASLTGMVSASEFVGRLGPSLMP